ncbi:hypothetical protein CIG75_06425 [Tumebacillus algifaecis]|uniref:Cell division protein DivIVA n=1 Tax=Tumebacillus algifaecis TaxID=1214604 RepID=A0A223CZ80_9BACL|nr:DUF2203 domain-containing protein [Tumebacillus algifaecis]ASS74641.1 hypothetical protein CIG75_06425 [Tumebacillus algifaecis]
MTAKRYFTVAEANALVPQLEKMIRDLQGMKREIQHKHTQLQEAKLQTVGNQLVANDAFFAEEAELEFLLFSANLMLGQIQGTGVEIKDIDTGLCDFYALRDGEVVLLCWRLGEPEIRHWHGVYDGFIGRRPIDF